MLSIYRVGQFPNTEFKTNDCRQSFIIAQMRETFNKMYSCTQEEVWEQIVCSYDVWLCKRQFVTKLMWMVHCVMWWPTRNQRNGNQTRRNVAKTHKFAKSLFPEMLCIKNLLRAIARTSCSRRLGPSKRTESMKATSTDRGDDTTHNDRARFLRPLSSGRLICHDRE